jgi:hypothetical protein
MTRNKFFATMVGVLMLLAGLSVGVQGQDVPNRIGDKQVKSILQQLKKDAERFRKRLDSSLDKSRLDGTNREDNINDLIKDYEKATERLYERFKDHKSVGADVEAVLDGAAQIDQFMTRRSVGGKAERDWVAVRQDLRRLAEAYNVSWRWWATD